MTPRERKEIVRRFVAGDFDLMLGPEWFFVGHMRISPGRTQQIVRDHIKQLEVKVRGDRQPAVRHRHVWVETYRGAAPGDDEEGCTKCSAVRRRLRAKGNGNG